MPASCIDCQRPIGINDDPTDGRCQECDNKHRSGSTRKRTKRTKSAPKDGGK